MPKCPKCKSPIDYLRAESRCSQDFTVYEGKYEFGEAEPYDETDFFFCPSCYEQLFEGDEEEEAKNFLQSDNLELKEYEVEA